MNMKLFYVFQYVFVVVMLLIVFPCYGQETSDSTKSQSEISASSDTETLTPLQQYRKLLLEGKYEEVLPIVDAAMSEKAKILVEEDPQKSLEDIRIEYLSFAYAEIYLLLDRNEEALKKFEENISQLSEKYSNKECCSIFTYRLILLSRLNRIDDFINECNNFINRPSPNMVDYFLGYLYGTMGYAVKKDYEKAKQYLSSAKHYFTVAFPNYNENDENLMVYKQYFEMFEIFLTTRLQDKYDLKPVTKPPTIVKSSDGSIEVKTLLSIEIVLKETGEPIAENEIDKMMKKWLEEKVQERQKKLQEDDPFLKEIRSNSTTNEWKISVTLLTPLQQYLKLLKEKKYKECLPLVETVTSENVKKYAEENPDVLLEEMRLEQICWAYWALYLLLGGDEEALKKFEETLSLLSEKQSGNARYNSFMLRLLRSYHLNKDFITECNFLINKLAPDEKDYLFGYLYGALGYAVKKDYTKAEQYLSSAKLHFTDGIQDCNDETSKSLQNSIEFCGIFLTYLKNEYDLTYKIEPIITQIDKETVSVRVDWTRIVISKKTGQPITENEFTEKTKKRPEDFREMMKKKYEGKGQEK